MPAAPLRLRSLCARKPPRRVALLICIVASLGSMPPNVHGAQDNPKTILLLNPADVLPSDAHAIDRAMFEVFNNARQQTEILSEYVAPHAKSPNELENDTVSLLAKKYRDAGIDLIMTRGESATAFMERYGKRIWPGVPAMAFSISDMSHYSQHLPAGMSGVLIGHDSAGNLALIRQLQPQVRHIVQIVESDTPDEARAMHEELRKAIKASGQDIQVDTVREMELPTFIHQIGNLPEDSALLAATIGTDRAGVFHVTGNIIQSLSINANVPLYGMRQGFLGNGVVGGQVTDLAAHGKQAAEMALKLLARPDAKPRVAFTRQSRCAVDDRELVRWHMNISALDSRCDRMFYTPSFWELHGRQIVVSIFLAAVVLMLLLALDLQRRKRIRADEEATRQKVALAHIARLGSVGELTASIVHEINQPLGAILANADAATMMLSQRTSTEQELKAILADIREDNLRASEIIKKLRTLLSKHALESRALSLNDIVETSRSLLGNLAIRHHATLQMQLQENLPHILGDSTHLQQVLINLAANAMEAMEEMPPEQRILRIRTELNEAGYVALIVSDSGTGIASDALPQMFDSFFTTKPDGMGMGLAIVKTIVEAHQGVINAWNNPHGGATFAVLLPPK